MIAAPCFAYNPMRLNVGSIGLWISPSPAIVSPDYVVFRCKDDCLDPDFMDFFRFTSRWRNQIKQSGDGSIRIRYYYRHIAAFQIDLPPIAEQRAIARVLRTVQKAIEATERVIAATRQLKLSLMRHLFTYGPVSLAESKSVVLQETEIGSFPSMWKLKRLGELIDSGPQNGLYRPESDYGSGTPVVRINDYPNEGGVIQGAPRRVRLSNTEVATYSLTEGDLLINRVNSLSHLGKVALTGELQEPTVFESNMMRFRVQTGLVTPGFAFHFLCTPNCRDALRGLAKRAVAQSSVNQGDVKSLLIPLPPLSVQDQITNTLEILESKVRAESRRMAALSAMFDSFLQNFMTGKVRTHDLGSSSLAEAV